MDDFNSPRSLFYITTNSTMSPIREGHPELAADFAVLDDFFSSVQASKLEQTKRVLARCCFLWHAEIPAEIMNAGEK